MIARILYRETVQGVLNYVFGKENRMILGFQNTYSEFDTDTGLFGNILYGLGQRKKSPKRYAHITLNLPHGEHLENTKFYEVAKEYMEQMGYGEQPYVVVRHDDTKHEHIHIVSTSIMDDGSSINLSHDYRRNVATQKYLEKTYGLSPSPETRSERQLPIYRLPELQFSTDDGNGNRFYLQEVLNSTFQKYNIRSIDELKILLEPYHIVIKQSINENGRVGVAYGLNNQKQYKTRFIDGYQVHPKLSGPKIKAVFERKRKSKLLPMHKKRLEKQLSTTMKLFESIRYEDLPDILKTYQNIDCELQYDRKQRPIGLTLYDKSGYVFNQAEIGLGMDFTNHPKLSDTHESQTYINSQSDQYMLEIRKLIKNAFIESYLASDKRIHLLSEFVMTKNLKDLLPHIANSKSYTFLNFYSGKNGSQALLKTLRQEFDGARNKLAVSQSKQEIKALEEKVTLFNKVMEISAFETINDSNIPFHLLQSLGLKYANGGLSFINSNAYSVSMPMEKLLIPKTSSSFVSTGFINQNEKVLEMLTEITQSKSTDLKATSFFLPMMFPELYDVMKPEHRVRFEELSLKAYHQKAEQLHTLYEKSPADYIKLFNAKGFYFKRKENAIHIGSIYSQSPVTASLDQKTQAYLNSKKQLNSLLTKQIKIIGQIQDNAQGQLKNLWVTYLVELKLYYKAAYMMVYDGVHPNLHQEVIEYHLGEGLREKLLEVSNQKINRELSAVLRKCAYAFSSILGNKDYLEEEAFNGFKDELTDYSKHRGVFM